MASGNGTEVGHKHFQHPGRTAAHFGPAMDRFSFIAIDVSLAALEAVPNLHKRYREGGEAIIFKANDYADPGSSEAFHTLAGIPSVAAQAGHFAAICEADIARVPSLEEFRAGRNIPVASTRSRSDQGASTAAYIGAYKVIDAADFDATIKEVGNKIELVGRIVSVAPGIGKHGRAKDKSYVLINFGKWWIKSVTFSIWPDALSTFSTPPDESWVGTWIYASGLIGKPFEGKSRKGAYVSVGLAISDAGEIMRLSEEEALFHLGRNKRKPAKSRIIGGDERASGFSRNPDKPVQANSEILARLSAAPIQSRPPRPKAVPPPPVPPSHSAGAGPSRNKVLLDRLKSSSARSASAPLSPAPIRQTQTMPVSSLSRPVPVRTSSPPSSTIPLPSSQTQPASFGPSPTFHRPSASKPALITAVKRLIASLIRW